MMPISTRTPTRTPTRRLGIALGTALLLASALGPAGPVADAKDPPPQVGLETIDDAIERGVAWLLEEQRRDGTWGSGDRGLGHTALAVFALLHGGLREDQEGRPAKRLRKAFRFLDREGPGRAKKKDKDPGTYTTSLLLLLLRERGRPVDRARMQRLVDLLVRTQADNGQWAYYGEPQRTGKRGPDVGDNSNTQFAVLALGVAVGEGLDVPAAALERARRWWCTSVHKQGGYGYGSGGSPKSQPTGSMTAAGIACLAVCNAALETPNAHREPLRRATAWMAEHFDVTRNEGPAKSRARQPKRSAGRGWLHYYLWTLERAMVLSDKERLGGRDWFEEGAAHLLATQYKDGSWRGEHPLYATSFALLFLTRAADPPRAFTRRNGTPAPVPDPARPVTGNEGPSPAAAPDPASPNPADPAPPTGTLEDWLDEALPPGELPQRCRRRGVSTLRPLVSYLGDPDRTKRQRAFEALSALLAAPRVHRVDRHPLARGRLDLWLRKHLDVLVLEGDRFVVP